jgi:hypothetical protein
MDLHWSNQLKYRALQWYRRRQDRQAERRGIPSSWHRVDPGATGSKHTAA